VWGFVPQQGPAIRVRDDPACWLVTANGTALNDRPGGVWDTVTKLLHQQ